MPALCSSKKEEWEEEVILSAAVISSSTAPGQCKCQLSVQYDSVAAEVDCLITSCESERQGKEKRERACITFYISTTHPALISWFIYLSIHLIFALWPTFEWQWLCLPAASCYPLCSLQSLHLHHSTWLADHHLVMTITDTATITTTIIATTVTAHLHAHLLALLLLAAALLNYYSSLVTGFFSLSLFSCHLELILDGQMVTVASKNYCHQGKQCHQWPLSLRLDDHQWPPIRMFGTLLQLLLLLFILIYFWTANNRAIKRKPPTDWVTEWIGCLPLASASSAHSTSQSATQSAKGR